MNEAKIEIGGRAVGLPLTPAETALVLNWLESEGVSEALASLRSPSAVAPPREALARALYIINGDASQEDARGVWFDDPDHIGTREHYGQRADRLLRVLGGFPVATEQEPRVQGVVFILRDEHGRVLMEKCPKKAARHGGEWFIPGGRVEDEDRSDREGASAEINALFREMWEEMRVRPLDFTVLPIVDACGGPGWPSFLMQPFLVSRWEGDVPSHTLDQLNVPLRWMEVGEAMISPSAALRARLASAIPPTPVVKQEPRAWECACGGVMPWRYQVCGECGEMVRADTAATPLYATPVVTRTE